MLKDLTTVQKTVLAALVALIVLSAGAVAFQRTHSLPPDDAAPGTPAASRRPLSVQVSGAVVHPGVYPLQSGDRVAQAVEAAGGLTPDAEAKAVNLARHLRDGQSIQIPRKQSAPPASVKPAAHPSSPSPPRPTPPPPPAAPAPVNLNTADATQLAHLPGLTRSLAQRIVAYRTDHGPFHRPEELLLVKGMTATILAQARPYLILP